MQVLSAVLLYVLQETRFPKTVAVIHLEAVASVGIKIIWWCPIRWTVCCWRKPRHAGTHGSFARNIHMYQLRKDRERRRRERVRERERVGERWESERWEREEEEKENCLPGLPWPTSSSCQLPRTSSCAARGHSKFVFPYWKTTSKAHHMGVASCLHRPDQKWERDNSGLVCSEKLGYLPSQSKRDYILSVRACAGGWRPRWLAAVPFRAWTQIVIQSPGSRDYTIAGRCQQRKIAGRRRKECVIQ